MKLCILHLSDLHRTTANPIDNDVLVHSLINDQRRYQREGIQNPDFIVVSGDIIMGIKPDCPDPGEELERQYDEAIDLLEKLTIHFLQANKERVIIVPGNHDISSYHAMQSLEKIELSEDENKKGVVRQLFSQNTSMRWSWDTLELFKISNQDVYRQRFEAFCNFYKKFYNETREYSLMPEEQFDIFSFPENKVVFVGFSSCQNNDILNKQGLINPVCIGKAVRILDTWNHDDFLRIGVWHHNADGLPMSWDYLDSAIYQNFIDFEFSIGLHGHQHKSQFIDRRFKHGEDRSITIISSGTLCGKPVNRHSRSYNLIELDTEENRGKLHVREMGNDDETAPIWQLKSFSPSNEPFTKLKFSESPKPLSAQSNEGHRIVIAQEKFDNGEFVEAAKHFEILAEGNELAKRLLIECYYSTSSWKEIVRRYNPPTSTTETVYLIEAMWHENMKDELKTILESNQIKNSQDVAITEIRNKYMARLKND